MGEPVKKFTSCEFPNDDLGVFSRARYKPVALADIDLGNVVIVTVQGRLQR